MKQSFSLLLKRVGRVCIALCLPFALAAAPNEPALAPLYELRTHFMPQKALCRSSEVLWPQYSVDSLLAVAESEYEALRRAYHDQRDPVFMRLQEVNAALRDPRNRAADKGYALLWEKMELRETLDELERETELKVAKLRYQKSIEMLKIVYEKILSMEHHFASLKAHQQTYKISNPNEYAEFKEVRTLLDEKMKKKMGFQVPNLVHVNPYLSAAFSIAGMFLGDNKEEKSIKKEQMEKLACIMDFTVRMHDDLDLIYLETEYLREANLAQKKECEMLFSDCARQVGYTIPLQSCRDSDDWERLFNLLDNMVNKAITGQSTTNSMNAGAPPAPVDPALQNKVLANLQFSVDRIIRFSEKYGEFVSRGNDYYRKFSKIISGYDNAELCSTTVPDQFRQLKNDIQMTLDKFNTAYALPEIQGSRLKDLMYGAIE
jgi:hypothetical protein